MRLYLYEIWNINKIFQKTRIKDFLKNVIKKYFEIRLAIVAGLLSSVKTLLRIRFLIEKSVFNQSLKVTALINYIKNETDTLKCSES